MPIASKLQLGKHGESLAKAYLLQKGYRYVIGNFHTRFGEIDLIFVHDNQIIFVEVKTRTSHALGYPEEAITPTKLNHLQKAAEIFLVKHKQYESLSPRIEVLAIDLLSHQQPEFRHYDNI